MRTLEQQNGATQSMRPRDSTIRRIYMNWERLEDRWTEFAGSAREHWNKLTNEDWQSFTGNKDQLVANIQKRYSIAKREAERQVEAWALAVEDSAKAPVTR